MQTEHNVGCEAAAEMQSGSGQDAKQGVDQTASKRNHQNVPQAAAVAEALPDAQK